MKDLIQKILAIPTAYIKPQGNPSIRSPGDTHAQNTGTSWISFWSDKPPLRKFSTHALITARTAIQTTPWCAARSSSSPRGITAARSKGILALMSASWASQTLWSSLLGGFESELKTSQTGDSATEKWATLLDTMHSTALATFGRKTLKSHHWFEAKSAEMTPVIEAKCTALAEYRWSPSERNLQILRAARSKAQQTARHCANKYWSELSETIQTAAITGNIRGMYDGIKTAMGPVHNKTAHLKSTTGEIITDKGQQMERWVEHYSDLYSRQNVATTAVLDAIECLPVMGQLDTELTTEELNNAIYSLASGKAPGSDGISPTWSSTARLPYCFLCMKSSASAGKMGLFHKTWGMPRSSPSTKTKVSEATVTTTEASRYSASWAKSSFGSSWSICRNLST